MNGDPNELKTLMLREPRLTLAVAESLTCGRLQALIGSVSGASEYFLGGVTAYSLDEKVKLLGVERAAAAKVNSVSPEVAEQMARGVAELFGADLAAATTGYAEPSADWNVAQPFAWIAVARRVGAGFRVCTLRLDCPGATRAQAQEGAAEGALIALVAQLRELRRN